MTVSMSYRCEVSFKHMAPETIYPFLQLFKLKVIENLSYIADDKYMDCPTIRYFHKRYRDLDSYAERYATHSWAENCFRYRYFYLLDHQLLGVYGVPAIVQGLFDDTIYFQNSTDQDYDFDTWDKIETFKNVADKWNNFTNGYVIEKCELEPEDDIDYHRRSACYNEIWHNYVRDSLVNDDYVVYFSCFGYYDTSHMIKFISRCEGFYFGKAEVMLD